MKSIPLNIILLLLSVLFFLPGLGGVHLFDWDEINFAEISREMIVSGNYSQIQIGFEPFWEKPPLFFWIQSLCMRIFGVNEFAARLPNALIGIAVIQYLFYLGKNWMNERFGWWWALAYFGSLLPHLYFRSGILDPMFNTLIFLGAVQLFKPSFTKLRPRNIQAGILAGLFLGAAVLVKGPVAVLVIGLVWLVGFFVIPRKNWLPLSTIFFATLFGLITLGSWFLVEFLNNGSWFLEQFIQYQIHLFSAEGAGHGGFPFYHFVVLLFGCFPMSWFALQSFWKSTSIRSGVMDSHIFRKWMIILLAVVVILFSAVQSKIVHYSSLAYFPLSFLAAYTLYQIELGKKLKAFLSWGLLINAIILALAALALPWLGTHITELFQEPSNTEVMATLGTPVEWPLWTFLPGIFAIAMILYILIGKKWLSSFRLNQVFISTAIFIFIALFAFIGRIENFTQRAAIEFCKEKGMEGYVINHGYKSYAPFFYGKVDKGPPEGESREKWLYELEKEKPVYMISRIHRVDRLSEEAGFEKIGSEGAFIFLKRKE